MAQDHETDPRLAKLEADNARLRRLLDAGGVPDGLRHGLRDTMAMLRAVLRLSADTAESVESYATHLEGRLDAIARVRVSVDMFGEISLHSLISDELMIHLIREGDQAELAGPAVRLRPKAAQVMALAVHELCSNAIEHGVLGLSRGKVAVIWSIDDRVGAAPDTLTLVWKETGGSDVAAPTRRGFGMQVLTEMLRYELNAHIDLAFEADGLRCTIRWPLAPRVGHVVDEAGSEEVGEPA
ncbi:Two-component sensor histidine kinase, contains HisKA and HATPase domains [Methylobacterium phyllostachyos]|uniref:histidine kinase n=1 Tax=Methylobacterium phyllostachyos TaxID=582672 RepID=A0A1G9VWA2_9HYPH|nr:sensor histidine kinase [Methylobacterium phyllostachyos]SDM76403.1 Two-component sensor histidine kinase, contains HisKA and HATPase domains [Methylobacterium phyllostachyos]